MENVTLGQARDPPSAFVGVGELAFDTAWNVGVWEVFRNENIGGGAPKLYRLSLRGRKCQGERGA
jgi:hypothetical protein